MTPLRKRSICIKKKAVQWDVLGVSVRASCSIVVFESSVSLPVSTRSFYQQLRMVLESLRMTAADLSISSCSSLSFRFRRFEALKVDA